MRIEIASATSAPAPDGPGSLPSFRPARLDRLEVAVLAAFAAVSLWVLGLDLWQVVLHGRTWTGTDGLYIVDQMQYLAWIRSASHHLLASNLFVLRHTPADYFQPAVTISGALTALGVAPWLTLLLWKPVAVLATFYAFREWARRSVGGRFARLAVIVLALFFGSFTVLYGSVGVIGDLFPGFLSWGYVYALLSLAAMAGALLLYDRARAEDRLTLWPGLVGALAGLLHPWHGELLIVTLVGAELLLLALQRKRPRAPRLAVLTLSLCAAPLLYYFVLGHADLSWELARNASRHAFSLHSILLALAPLLLPALLGYRQRAETFLQAATQAWPAAALAVFIVSASGLSATPLHAFQGVTLPLAVLAVQGVQRTHWRTLPNYRWLAGTAVALLTIPATIYELKTARDLASPTADNANFISSDEKHALDYLEDDPQPGGVLTRSYLGAAVPERTGRRTLIGDCLWSEPNCYARSRLAQALFDGSLRGPAARRFVRRTGARFLLADCSSPADLPRTLGFMLLSAHKFGCATVYELAAAGRPFGPLAESRRDAALRAPRRQQR